MGRVSKQTFFQRKYTDNQQAHEKLINITNNQGMQIKNHSEIITPHLLEWLLSKIRSLKCWRGCGKKGTVLYCQLKCKLVQPLWKTVQGFYKKLKIEPPCGLAVPLLKKTETAVRTALFTITEIGKQRNVHQQMDKEDVVRTPMEYYYSARKRMKCYICNNMDGPSDYYAQ